MHIIYAIIMIIYLCICFYKGMVSKTWISLFKFTPIFLILQLILMLFGYHFCFKCFLVNLCLSSIFLSLGLLFNTNFEKVSIKYIFPISLITIAIVTVHLEFSVLTCIFVSGLFIVLITAGFVRSGIVKELAYASHMEHS